MIPGVGLYLPETLHRSDAHILKQANGEERTSAPLHHKGQRASQDTSTSPSQGSIDQKSISSEAATDVVNPTATAFDYADFVFALNKRSAEVEIFASLIWRTRQDLAEASRLYLSPTVTNFLDAWPDRKTWIDRILSDVRTALVDIGNHIESVRSSRDEGEASRVKRKFEYTLNHHKRLAPKQQTLGSCHQVLLGAVQVMQTVEQCVGLGGPVPDPIFEAPVRPWIRSGSDVIRSGPYSRRSSSRNISSLSVTTSESPDTFEMKLPEAPPAELPGSTPDDGIHSGTRTTSKSSRPPRSHLSIDASVDSPTAVPLRGKQEHTKPDASPILPNSLSGPNCAQEGVVHNQANQKSAPAPSSLNSVVDKIIERTQSIASTTTSIRMPVLAKRYRPRPVHVQKPHLRHHSLPSRLPPYQSQSSLEDDLREWMVHTAASDQFTGTAASDQSTGITLTRSPTASSTAGSIASRQEMMKLLANFPNVREDNESPVVADTAVHGPPIAQDDATPAANYQLPPSEPNSPPMAFETAHPQKKTVSVTSYPPPFSQPNRSPTASEAVHSQEDMTLVASFPLPPSQPSSPPLASRIPHQTECTVASRRRSATTRKSLPAATQDGISTPSSFKTSPAPHHPELYVGSNAVPESSHAQTNAPRTPAPPQRAPPQPPPQSTQEDTPQPERPAFASPHPSPPVQITQHDAIHQPPPTPHTTTTPPPSQSDLLPLPRDPVQDPRVQNPQSMSVFPQNASVAAPVPMVPAVPPVPVVEADTRGEQPGLRTAEAKRRAARARRMRIAFGG